MAGRLDFTNECDAAGACEQGATFRRQIQWTDSAGAAIDLTGATARMQVRKRASDATVIAELTTENDGLTITPLTGIISMLISASDTAALDPNCYVYDLEVVQGETVTRLVEGKFQVTAEVTR